VGIATNYLFPKAATPTPLPPPTNQVPQAVTGPGAGQPIFGIPTSANPFYPLNTTLSLSIYITNSGSRLGIFDPTRSKDVILAEPIIWEDIKWGNWKDERAWSGSVNLPRVRIMPRRWFCKVIAAPLIYRLSFIAVCSNQLVLLMGPSLPRCQRHQSRSKFA
jgi:hypothetical protein